MPRHPPYALSSLATLIERSLKSCQLLAVSQTFDQCSVSCLHVSSRYVVVQMAGDGFTWTSNARTNLRTNKESWPNMLPDRRACARRSMARLAKMPLLQLPNCQRALAAEAARSVTSYRAHPSNNYRGCLTNGQRPTRQHILPGYQMPYQPLATRGGLPTDERALNGFAPSVETHNISARVGRVKLRAR